MDSSVKATIYMAMMFIVAQVGAIFMIQSILADVPPAFENPNDPLIPVYYIIAMVAFTFAILYIIKKKRESVVRIIFLGAVGFTVFYVLLVTMAAFTYDFVSLIASIIMTAVLMYYLLKKPEWYVVDAAGILMAVGVIGIFGISLSILPVMILLIILAVYDAISVYGTKHMVALADGVTQMRLPILLVIPKHTGYSYLEQKPLKQQIDEGEEREAMFMGLGDVIIPGILVASAFNFLPEGSVMGIDANLVVAIGTLVGILMGFGVLMRYVLKGNPQAGLPLLNGGAIIAYLVSYLLAYGDLSFGMTLSW
jgi:presenilin-like A22 family membrane protease